LIVTRAESKPLSPEIDVTKTWIAPTTQATEQKRTAERRILAVPARLTWKDQRGTTRFASVMTRNMSEFGVYVECQSPVSIPLYRLVQFQLERDVRDSQGLPASLRQGRALSAVYRVNPPTASGVRQGLALRLMVDPRRQAAIDRSETQTRATA
jgi:hypothetical protein